MTTTELVRESHHVAHRHHLITAVLARSLSFSLDRQLASGRSQDATRLLAARAQQLTSPATRNQLADDWRSLSTQARRAAAPRAPRVPLRGDEITAAAPAIDELRDALSSARPVSARGVAMANGLLRDGTGPLYDRRSQTDVADAVRRAIAALDPTIAPSS